ncbi:MAG: TlpA family protein disulfide reductase [Bacteroidetes bacterium]|nr:TlpA family protein disulfide reductase [Bacteroidota bacterium]
MRKNFALLTLMLSTALATIAQTSKEPTLMIGDKAPELRYSKWLKGTPVKKYEPGRLYIVEFWATWCGPCIASMPHLSKFQKEHAKEVTVIGVDIWEGGHDTARKAYDSYYPKVSRFVKSMGDKMAYNVTMDNNAEFMSNQWMKAAGQDGIPCSFMIKDGTILWIGHPIQLDSIINVVNDKNYDVMAARKAAIDKRQKGSPETDAFKAVYGAYAEAVKQKEYQRAIDILDSSSIAMPRMAGTLGFFKFQVLLENVNEDTALAFAKKWQETKPGYVGSTGAVICRRPGLKKATYEYGISLLKSLADTEANIPAVLYNEMAGGYANMGDYAKAAETEEHAIMLGKQALKDGKFAGFIREDTIKEYEKTLAGYKSHVK